MHLPTNSMENSRTSGFFNSSYSQVISDIYGTRKSHNRVRKYPPLLPVLTQTNPVHASLPLPTLFI